ncbi:MAG: squalene--hopene cyclase [Phycisphaerales bacterium]
MTSSTLPTAAAEPKLAPPAHSAPFGEGKSLASRARGAVAAAAAALLAKQRTKPWGGRAGRGNHWCAELEGDSILSSEYLLMKFILGHEGEPGSPEWNTHARIANQLRLSQREDGTWGQYPGSPADLSACVKAYFTLKLFGDGPQAPHMARAREAIIARGGAERINTFSMFYLACLGQVSWEACPAIPPQIVLLPRWFPFHLDKVAAWTRTMILPLALCSALQPVRSLPREMWIDELFIDQTLRQRLGRPWDGGNPFTWNNFFLAADKFIKWCRRSGLMPLRDVAVQRAEEWIKQRMDPASTEGLGAIFPPMVYVQVAFQALGYTRDHPIIRQAEADLDAFMIDEPHADPRLDHIRLQPCFSPVWDTAIALDALTEAGLTGAKDDRVAAACDWLIDREVKRTGDWINNLRPADRNLRPGVDMACWAFEYRNDWYPDVDDTCMVAKALHRCGDRPNSTRNRDAAKRAVRWILAMQNDDGGWAAFDRTTDRPWMEAIPFADHNAMQDPSCSDITGRVTEALVCCGVERNHEAITRAVEYLVRTQQPEGCWWGRWGVNYIYGTWQAVNGLVFAANGGVAPVLADGTSAPPDLRGALDKARAWLLSVQNADGGFGESANSYLDRSLMGRGESTASQTAWGLITLMHLLPAEHEAVRRAAAWLMDDQLTADKGPFAAKACRLAVAGDAAADAERARLDHVRDRAGGWSEHFFTGTGFPKVFYLRYHLYRHSFPLKALARYAARVNV